MLWKALTFSDALCLGYFFVSWLLAFSFGLGVLVVGGGFFPCVFCLAPPETDPDLQYQEA